MQAQAAPSGIGILSQEEWEHLKQGRVISLEMTVAVCGAWL